MKKNFIVAALYFATGKLGVLTAIPPGVATVLWPPSGIALSATLLYGGRVWPGILLGSLFTNLEILVGTKGGWPIGLPVGGLIALGSLVQALVGASLIERWTGNRHPFDRVSDVFRFVVIESVTCVIAATIGTAALLWGRLISEAAVAPTWSIWWVGDFVGVLTFAPALLILNRQRFRFSTPKRLFESLVLLLLLITICVLLLGRYHPSELKPQPYMALPLLFWATFRFGQVGMILANTLVAAIMIWGAVNGLGPFITTTLVGSLLSLQVFVGVISVLGLWVSALLIEQRQSEEELDRSNKDLENFASLASHDLQEPLRMIASYLSLLSQRYRGKLDAQADEFIEFSVEGARRMKRLIDGLLAFSRVGKSTQVGNVDCNEILQTALANLKLAIEENGARFTVGRLATVQGDAGQLTQLFQNLIGNGIKYRRACPPEVHIHCEFKGSEIVFSVKDNGTGFEMQYSDRIFEIFKRLHRAEEVPGSGIGLALCRRVVENHGGRIWVESQPGQGSTFFFTLPQASHSSDSGA